MTHAQRPHLGRHGTARQSYRWIRHHTQTREIGLSIHWDARAKRLKDAIISSMSQEPPCRLRTTVVDMRAVNDGEKRGSYRMLQDELLGRPITEYTKSVFLDFLLDVVRNGCQWGCVAQDLAMQKILNIVHQAGYKCKTHKWNTHTHDHVEDTPNRFRVGGPKYAPERNLPQNDRCKTM